MSHQSYSVWSILYAINFGISVRPIVWRLDVVSVSRISVANFVVDAGYTYLLLIPVRTKVSGMQVCESYKLTLSDGLHIDYNIYTGCLNQWLLCNLYREICRLEFDGFKHVILTTDAVELYRYDIRKIRLAKENLSCHLKNYRLYRMHVVRMLRIHVCYTTTRTQMWTNWHQACRCRLFMLFITQTVL